MFKKLSWVQSFLMWIPPLFVFSYDCNWPFIVRAELNKTDNGTVLQREWTCGCWKLQTSLNLFFDLCLCCRVKAGHLQFICVRRDGEIVYILFYLCCLLSESQTRVLTRPSNSAEHITAVKMFGGHNKIIQTAVPTLDLSTC